MGLNQIRFEKNFDEWNSKKKARDISNYKPPLVNEGDVWWASIGLNIGSEIDGKGSDFTRPVLILKKISKTFFLIAPTTSKEKSNNDWYVKVSHGQNYNYVSINQVKTIDYRRLWNRFYQLDTHDFEKVSNKFKDFISVKKYTPIFSDGVAGNPECNDIISFVSEKSQELNSNLVLGIDPGYDRVGIAIIDKTNNIDKLVFSTCILTDKKSKDYERINQIVNELESVIKKYKTHVLNIETLFMFKNQKTVMSVSEARGAIKYICHKNDLIINEFTPMQVKSSLTGNGHAEKSQVEYMVRNILKLEKDKKYLDDEIDAMAVALIKCW